MKFHLITILLFAFAFKSFGSGMTTHMYMSEEAIKYVKSPALQKLLRDEKKAYLNGSIFPDSGYPSNGLYGEWAHWSGFQNIYFENIKEKCSFPFNDNCKSIFAHFLGSISHSLADINFDTFFLNNAIENLDFENIDDAQKLLDSGIDFTVITKNKRYKMGKRWVPYDFLAPILKEEFPKQSKKDLIKKMKKGNLLLRIGLVGERAIAPFGALNVKLKAPWSFKNYMKAQGGVTDTAKRIAEVFNAIWESLNTFGMSELPILHHSGPWSRNDYWVESHTHPKKKFGSRSLNNI